MNRLLISIALTVALSTSASSQSPTLALAQEYANLPGVQGMMDEMSSPQAMAAQFGTQLPPNVQLSPEQQLQIGGILSGVMQELRPRMTELMISGSAETFTANELEALIAFYSSEHGASVMTKMQPFMLGVMAKIGPEMQQAQQAVLPQNHGNSTRTKLMAKAFASAGDMTEKKISFTEVGRDLWAFTAEGDPNSGVIIGDDSVMVIEAQATPRLANKVIEKIRSVTDKPITHLVLTHYHAVRVLGASAYDANQIIMSEKARSMVVERGQEDWDSEFDRFPRLFEGHESIPGLTYPTTTFNKRMSVYLGNRRVDLMYLGRAHTAGDIVAYVPDANVMFTGDIVEYKSACYCGDGHFHDWPGNP